MIGPVSGEHVPKDSNAPEPDQNQKHWWQVRTNSFILLTLVQTTFFILCLKARRWFLNSSGGLIIKQQLAPIFLVMINVKRK
jgi:hypothetical protein